jgi:hypothetical protein
MKKIFIILIVCVLYSCNKNDNKELKILLEKKTSTSCNHVIDSIINVTISRTVDRTIFTLSKMSESERQKLFLDIKKEHKDWK